MSDTVVFDPALESADAFNTRMSQFCQAEDTPVVNVTPSFVRGRLVLALAAPQDYPVPLLQVLQPVVVVLAESQLTALEYAIGAAQQDVLKHLDEELNPEGTAAEDRIQPFVSMNQVFDIEAPQATADRAVILLFVVCVGVLPEPAEVDEESDTVGTTAEGE